MTKSGHPQCGEREKRATWSETVTHTVIDWSLNRLGSLNDLAVEPQVLLDSRLQFDGSFLKKHSKDFVLTSGARHCQQVPQPVTLESRRGGCMLPHESPGVPYSLGSLEGYV